MFTRSYADVFTGDTRWKDIQVPEAWSQVAVDILAQKYFRKAGVPFTI